MKTHHPPLTTFLDPHLAAFHLALIAADAGLPADRASWHVLNRFWVEEEGLPAADLYAARRADGWHPVTPAQARLSLAAHGLVCACGVMLAE